MSDEQPAAIELVRMCAACRSGAGGECHEPECGLWMNRAPDIPVESISRPRLEADLAALREAAQAVVDADKQNDERLWDRLDALRAVLASADSEETS